MEAPVSNHLASLRTLAHDVASALLLRPARIGRIASHYGPWMFAVALAGLGFVASVRHDFPGDALAVAVVAAAAFVGLLTWWSRVDDESLQRSYVAAGICGVIGIASQSQNEALNAALGVWLVVAWVFYMMHRLRKTD